MSRRYTDDAFKQAVLQNVSMIGTLTALGMSESGGNYRTANHKIRLLGLDTSHWTGSGYLKGKTHDWSKKFSLAEKLVAGRPCTAGVLRKQLIREGVLADICAKCGIGNQWHGAPLVLHLDHISGDSLDNRLENLRILCPNCHSQTPTWAGRNAKHPKKIPRTCACGNSIHAHSSRCAGCAQKARQQRTNQGETRNILPTNEDLMRLIKASSWLAVAVQFKVSRTTLRKILQGQRSTEKREIIWPAVCDLQEEIAKSSYSAVARRLGVSDNAVRKRLKTH